MGAIAVASLFDLADTSGLASIVLGGWSGDRLWFGQLVKGAGSVLSGRVGE